MALSRSPSRTTSSQVPRGLIVTPNRISRNVRVSEASLDWPMFEPMQALITLYPLPNIAGIESGSDLNVEQK